MGLTGGGETVQAEAEADKRGRRDPQVEGRLPASPEVDRDPRSAYSARVYESTQFRRSPVKKFVPAALSILLLCALPGLAQTSPDGATYSQIRDMAVRAYRAVHGATGTLAQVEATASAAVQTNDAAYLASVADGDVLATGLFSSATNTSGNAYPTLDQVRGLLSSGGYWYGTTNAGAAGFTPCSLLHSVAPATETTNSLAVASNGQWIAGGITTSAWSSVKGPVTFRYNMAKTAGNSVQNIAIHPELFYTYDRTNLVALGIAGSQTVNSTNILPYSYLVSFADPALTNDAYIVGRLKVDSFSASAGKLRVTIGGDSASHLSIPSVETESLGSRGATNVVLTGYTCVYDAVTRTLTLTAE